jgi:hypothetical protein
MINISNCPITGLKREVDYNFFWYKSTEQIIIECTVTHYKNNEVVENAAIKTYKRNLVASDNLVDPQTGHIFTQEELDASPPPTETMKEYDFYAYVLGVQPLVLPELIEQIILARDQEGKFDI